MKKQPMTRIASQCLLALAAVMPLAVSAAQCSLISTGVVDMADSERAQLLQDFKFAELDKLFAKQHKKNLSQPGGDLLTLRDLAHLEKMTSHNEQLVRMWVDERPESFFAQMYAGFFYEDRAFSVRGSEAASTVNSRQYREMDKISEKAQVYVKKAMALDPDSALPHSAMIGMAAMLGKADARTADQWLQAANQVDPKNLATRIQAVSYLSPRWGGSFEKLDQIAAQAEKALPSEAAYYLAYNVVLAKASHFEVIEKDKPKAQALYKQAKSMCENSEIARSGIVRTY